MSQVRSLFVISAIAVVGATFLVLRPAAEETEAPEPPKVSESELETFIEIYTAMQMDHGLTIEKAIEPHSLTLDGFRALERRVQSEERLVDRVRQALLGRVQGRSLFVEASNATPSILDATPAVPSDDRED